MKKMSRIYTVDGNTAIFQYHHVYSLHRAANNLCIKLDIWFHYLFVVYLYSSVGLWMFSSVYFHQLSFFLTRKSSF